MENAPSVVPLTDILRRIPDPRMEKKNGHRLVDILVIAICAIICGAEHWTEMEDFGKCKEKWFRSFLDLPNGIPSHDTFGRMFAMISPKQFQQCCADWVQGFMQGVDVRHICLDGKTARGSRRVPANKKAVHMISAYAREGFIKALLFPWPWQMDAVREPGWVLWDCSKLSCAGSDEAKWRI
ncbi:MAG: ISAs1 family transposase [Planctomycetes bacterium]|nr:ISAs1 family transposase [Planctomycetota bacterium]